MLADSLFHLAMRGTARAGASTNSAAKDRSHTLPAPLVTSMKSPEFGRLESEHPAWAAPKKALSGAWEHSTRFRSTSPLLRILIKRSIRQPANSRQERQPLSV